jgi:hypothetical protein
MQGNTIEILNSINKTVSQIASMMAPQNISSARGVAALSKGITTPKLKEENLNVNVSKTSIDSIKSLSSISPVVLSFKDVNMSARRKMKRAVEAVVEAFNILEGISNKKMDMKKIADAATTILPAIVAFSKVENVSVKNVKKTVNAVIDSISLLYNFGKTRPDLVPVSVRLSKTANNLVGVISKLGQGVRRNRGAIRNITTAVMGMVGLTVAMLGLGYLIMNGDTKKILLGGLAGLGAVMVATTGVILLTGLAGKVIKSTGLMTGLKDIVAATLGMGVLVGMMFGLGVLLTKGDTWKIIRNGLIGLGTVMVATAAVILLTGLAGKIIKNSDSMKGLRSIFLFTIGSIGLIVASKFLGDFIVKNKDSILVGLGSVGTVMLGLVGLGVLAGTLLKNAKAGIAALATVELLAVGAMGLMFAVTKLNDHLKQYNAKELALTVLGVVGVVSAFGVLAGIAGIGPVAAAILLGSAALGTVELMAFGAIKLVDTVMGLHKRKEESGLPWKELEKDVLGVSGIVGTFGVVAGAFSLLTIPIALATPGILALSGFALSCIGIMNRLFELDKKIREGGGVEGLKKLVNTDMPSVVKGFSMKNYNPELSLLNITTLSAKYAGLALLSLEFLGTAKNLSKLANIGSIMDGNMIRPIKRIDKETGEMTLGDPVDIIATANSITNVVRKFVDNCNYGIKDVAKMMATSAIFTMLGIIVNPVTKFINMLTGFIGDADGKSLTPIKIDDQGNVHMGQRVDVKNVAGIIANTLSSFVGELYSDENAAKWAQYVYGREDGSLGLFKNKKTRAIKKVAGILGIIVSPISDFMEMLTTMEGDASGTTLTPFTVDAEGNIKPGKPINVAQTSATISSAITKFVSGLFTDANVATWNELNRKGRKALETVFTSMTDMIGVVKDLGDEKSINNKNLEMNIASVQKLMDTVYREDFESATEKLNKFSTSTIQLKTNISNLDSVLIKENEKRKKSIEDFGNSIESMLKKFEGANDSISNLHDLVIALQTMDADRVSSIISSMNLNNYTNKTSGTVTTRNIESVQPRLSVQDISAAIRDALDGMHLVGGSTSENQSMDDVANVIVAALRDVRFDIDLNK